MLRFLPLALVASLLVCPPDALGQGSIPDSAQRFLILDTSKTETLPKELDQAAVAGYRAISGNAAYNFLVLEKASEPASRPEYRVLWSLSAQLKKASDEGFRVIAATFGTKDFPAAVVERVPDAAIRYEYLVIDATRTSTFEREIIEGTTKGYRIIGMVSGENRHAAVLERNASGDSSAPSTAVPSDRFKLLAANKSSTLQTELSAHAARGYRVLFASAAKETLVLVEKPPDRQENPEYLVVTTTKSATQQQEMNDAASRGSRLLPRTMVAVQKRLLLGQPYGYEIGAIMEKLSAPGPKVEYLVLGARRVSTLAKELSDAAARGYGVVRMIVGYEESLIVLERPRD